MALSEQEQKLLREIEESLLADDPKFGSSVAQAPSQHAGSANGKLTMRSLAIIVLGLLLLVGGVVLAAQSMWFVALSIAGFIVMFAGGLWALRTPSSAAGVQQRSSANGAASRNGVSSRMEENFRRRFEGQ